MNRSNVTTLTAILFAVGVISPAAFGGQFHPQADLTSLVVADSSGIQKGEEFIRDDTLEITSDIYGSIGITAVDTDGTGFEANLCRRDDCTGLKVSVDLGQTADSVGILLGEGASLNLFRDAQIKAETAIRGSGTVYLGFGAPARYDIVGGLDMREGTIRSEAENSFHYVGIGDLGRFEALAGHLIVGKTDKEGGETFLRIGTLQLGDGASVTVVGDQADGSGFLADNRVLIVQRLEATARPEWAPPSESEQRAVNLKGEATLILGTELAQGESVKDLRANILNILNTSEVNTGSFSRATLITGANVEIDEGISVVVGEEVSEENVAADGIHIGNDGRWIVHFEDDAAKSTVREPVSLGELTGMDQSGITAEAEADARAIGRRFHPVRAGHLRRQGIAAPRVPAHGSHAGLEARRTSGAFHPCAAPRPDDRGYHPYRSRNLRGLHP